MAGEEEGGDGELGEKQVKSNCHFVIGHTVDEVGWYTGRQKWQVYYAL